MKEWGLSVCAACIVTAVLQTFAEAEKQNRNTVIKTVFTLYILVLVLSPTGLPKMNWEDINIQSQSVTETITPQLLTQMQTKATLESKITEVLDNELHEAASVQVVLDAQNPADVRVASVTVTLAQAGDEAAIRNCIFAVLGTQTEIIINGKE